MISGAATTPALTGMSNLFVRTISSDASQGKVIADYAIKKEYKKVAILQETADYTSSISNAFSKTYTSVNGTIIKEEFLSSTNDLRTQLAKLKSENPDALFLLPNSPATIQKMAETLRILNWKVQILGVDMFGSGTEPLVKNKDIYDGAIVAQQNQAVDSKEYIAFRDAYEKRFGKKLIYEFYAQAQYDLVNILRDALVKEGEDNTKITTYMKNLKNYIGFSGNITIDENGDRVGGHVLKLIKDGNTADLQ